MTETRKSLSAGAWLAIALTFALGLGIGLVINSTPSTAPAEIIPVSEQEGEEASGGVATISVQAQEAAGLSVEISAYKLIAGTLAATGTIAPDRTRTAHMRTITRGVVTTVHVGLGDRVKAGDPLVSYDNIELGVAVGEYRSARAELRHSLVHLEIKQKVLERSKKLLDIGALSQFTYDVRNAEHHEAEAAADSARARVATIEEQLHRYGLSDEDVAELEAEDESGLHRTDSRSVIRAPFAGVVTEYNAAEGEAVETSDQLMTVVDTSTVWVLANIYEKDLAAVSLGSEVAIRVSSYPQQLFTGRITYISDVIDPLTRTASVRCVVPNPGSRLKLDMFATVEIPTTESREFLIVSKSALQRMDDQPVVFVRKSDTEFERRDVVVEQESGGLVAIREGLREGEKVVAEGSFYVKSALLRELIGEDE